MKKPKNRTKTKRTTKRDSISKLDLPLKSYKEKPELIHDNPYQASESIAKALVDKIITISVRKSHNNHLNKIYKNYYFDCMQNQLDILFATNYLYYYDEPENEERNKIFWNKNLEKKNTWVEITEPNSSKIDRYENVFMQFINYNPPHVDNIDNKKSSIMRSSTFNEGNSNKDDLFDSKIPNNASQKFSLKIKDVLNKKGNEILDILEEKSSASSKDEDTNRKKKKITKVRKSIKHITKTKKKNSISPKRDSLIKSISPKKESSKEKKNSDDEDISKNKKSKRQSILAMNFIEIPNIDKESNNEIYSPPDVEKLRKAVIEGKIKKEKEEKKHALIKKMTSINNVENIFGDDNKMIDSNKLTFDSNGKIISFKPIKIESFNKDFLSLKNGIKSLEINNANNKKSRFKRNKNKNQNEIIQREKSYDKEIIIKNPEDDPEGKNSINYVKMSAIKNEQKIPSGSNFSLMLPNIGVTLREDDQVKEGKKEFGKYFKKYSMNDYDKILHEFLPLQNKTLIKNQLNQAENLTSSSMNMTSVNKKNKYISTNPLGNNLNNFNMTNTTNTPLTQTLNYNTISELPNPLINQQETIQENDINTNNNNNSSFIKTNKSMNSYYSGNNIYSGSMSRLYNNNMSNFTAPKFIMLNKNCSSTSLKNEIENLKDLNEESNLNIYPSKIKLKSRNIFLDNYKEFYKNKRIKEKTINLIDSRTNELNKKIMINGLWGSQTLQKNKSSGNLLYGKHLTKYQALRELGSNLLTGIKIKLPRDRKVDINI
jgi:hypothetical protein